MTKTLPFAAKKEMRRSLTLGSCYYCYCMLLLWLLSAAFPATATTHGKKSNNGCPCSNPDWCNPIKDTTRNEVFAFSLKNDSSHWSKYDWSKVTTVVMVGYVNSELMCLAHAVNARVTYIANSNLDFTNSTQRTRWVKDQLVFIQQNHLDGVNFDFEGLIAKNNSALRDGYTSLVAETNVALKKVFPSSQVTVDVAWKQNTDQRFYDYKGLANHSDFLFVMSYDEQSQIYGECLAMPNSGFTRTEEGLSEYITLGIARSKLVLGLPWYGYIYPCVKAQGDKCFLKPVPFRGVACSDAAGREYDYSYIRKLSNSWPVQWNSTSSTPFFTYTSDDGSSTFQVQFDNPQSLSMKYAMAERMGLRGVGMWNIDTLNYDNSPEGHDCRREMFGALPAFRGGRKI